MPLSKVEFQATFIDEMTSALNKAFDNFQERIQETDEALEDNTKTSQTYGQLWKGRISKSIGFGAGAIKVAAGVVAAFGTVLVASLKFVADWESAVLNARDGVGYAAGEIRTMSSVTTDLSLKLMTSRDHILGIAGALREAGITMRSDGIQILEFATKLSVASGASADDTARYVTTLTKGFKLSYTEMRKVSNAMLEIGTRTGQSVAETESLFQASKEYLQFLPKAVRAKAMTSIVAMGGALSEMGVDAEDAMSKVGEMMDISSSEGNRFKAAISQFMQIPVGEVNKLLEQGRPDLLFAKMQKQVKGMEEPTGVMVSHMKALGGASFVNIFKGLQEGPDIMKSMAAGAGKAAEEQAQLDQMFDRSVASLGNFWQALKNVFVPFMDKVLRPLLEELTPHIVYAAKFWREALSSFDMKEVLEDTKQYFRYVVDFWTDKFGSLLQIGSSVVGWVRVDFPKAMKEGVAWWIDQGSAAWNGIKDTAAAVWKSIRNFGLDTFGAVTKFMAVGLRSVGLLNEDVYDKLRLEIYNAKQAQTGAYVEQGGMVQVHAGETIVPPRPTADFPSMMAPTNMAADISPLETAPRGRDSGNGVDMSPMLLVLREIASLIRRGQQDPDAMPPGMAGASALPGWGL